MPKIVILCRTTDAFGISGRIYDALRRHSGRGAVFLDDVDQNAASDQRRFREVVDRARKADVFNAAARQAPMASEAGGRIFISHSSRDRKVAETLVQALEARGLPCRISSRDVPGGANYQASIVHAIRNAKVMLLVFTESANNSDEIKKEIALASRNNLVVIPVRIEDVVPNDALEFELSTRQWIDFFGDWERAVEALFKRILSILRLSLRLG